MSNPMPARSITLDEFIEVASTAALRAIVAQKQTAGPTLAFEPHIWIGIIASEKLGQVLERSQEGRSAT